MFLIQTNIKVREQIVMFKQEQNKKAALLPHIIMEEHIEEQHQ